MRIKMKYQYSTLVPFRPLSPKVTSLIRPHSPKATSLLRPLTKGHLSYKATLTKGHLSYKATLTKGHLSYKVTPTKGHHSYQVRFQMHLYLWPVSDVQHVKTFDCRGHLSDIQPFLHSFFLMFTMCTIHVPIAMLSH